MQFYFKIYVIAGHNGEYCQNSAECYNPLTDQWAEISSMSDVRRSAAAVAVGGKILVVGGFVDMSVAIIESCEIFDPSVNQWSLVPSLSIPRARSGIVGVGDTVYLFGGEDEEVLRCEVQYFDSKTSKWNEISYIPNYPFTGLRASLLKFPKHFMENNN